MKKSLLILILVLIYLSLFSQDNMNSGIIYGENFSYSLTAPEGWLLDNESVVNQGLDAVFYEKGESWKSAETVMYTNTASFEDTVIKNVEDLIKYDLENFKKNYGDIKSSDGKEILTKDGKSAKVKYFLGDVYGNLEAIAYIGEEKIGVMIVMSSNTESGFNNSLIAFEKLVKSYFFITKDVRIKKE